MDPSRSHRLIHVINNCFLYVTFVVLCFDLSFIKFLINTREKQELSGVELGTSDLLASGCPTEPWIPDSIIYICNKVKFVI